MCSTFFKFVSESGLQKKKKKKIRPFEPQFGLKIIGGLPLRAPPLDPPLHDRR